MAANPGSVRCVADVGGGSDDKEENDLGEEPAPGAASAAFRGEPSRAMAAGVVVGDRRLRVEVVRLDRDDVVVVRELACLGAEAKVGNVGNRGRVGRVKAERPLVLVLILQLYLELLVLEVCDAHLGGHIGVADAARGATGKLARLAIVGLVVRRLAVAKHGHDVRKHGSGAVVLVRVDKDAQTLKLVLVAKDIALLAALFRHPHGHTVAVQLVLARDLEFHLNLPVSGRERHTRKQGAGLRRAIGSKTNVSASRLVSELRLAVVQALGSCTHQFGQWCHPSSRTTGSAFHCLSMAAGGVSHLIARFASVGL